MFRLVVALSVVCLISGSPLLENADRIVNGRQASMNEHSYMCSLQKSGSHFCGAIILNEKQCLTAAHCFNKLTVDDIPFLQVRCGSLEWNSGGVLRDLESYRVHENYDRGSSTNDIAIFDLKSKIIYNNKMKPIKLASETPEDDTSCRVSGWGRLSENNRNKPTMLQTANILSVSKDMCASFQYRYGSAIQGKVFCGIAEGTDACQGDSGGPLVNNDDDTLVGIVSWGRGCAEKDHPGVYSDVALLKPWIEAHSK